MTPGTTEDQGSSPARFAVERERGFLPRPDPLAALPGDYQAWEELAASLPDVIAAGVARPAIAALPLLDTKAISSDGAARRAMLLLSYFGHAYVWASPDPVPAIPAVVARPWYEVATRLGRPPVLSYASYALDNWHRLDAAGPIALGNLALRQRFLGGLDEEWFILVHVEIEAKAAPALAALWAARTAAETRDEGRLTESLAIVGNALERMLATLRRMPEHCDPYIYFRRVRPYIHGWRDHPAYPAGLAYEGVAAYGDAPQRFRGETGAQSTIVPALDAALGIQHPESPLRVYLEEMRDYMPPAHRELIATLSRSALVRSEVQNSSHPPLRRAYNRSLRLLSQFRSHHLDYARRYIFEQSGDDPANPTAVGTGGTPFLPYLEEHRDTTLAHILPE